MKFDSLIRQGILSKDYTLIKNSDFTLHTISSINKTVKLENNGIVVLDNSQWVARHGKVFISHDGTNFGKWDEDISTFFNQSLSDNKLTVRKKQIINVEKETLIMSEKDIKKAQDEAAAATVTGGDEIEDIINGAMADAKSEVKESKAFDGGNKPEEKPEKELSDDEKKVKETIDAVIGKVTPEEVVASENRLRALRNFARKHGRLEATIVKTNSVVKIYKDKKLFQNAKGEYVFLATGDGTERSAFESSDKKKVVGERKNYQHVVDFTYKHYRAGAMTGVIISVPEGANEISLSAIKGKGEINVNETKTELTYKVMPMAYAESFMLSHFGDMIREKYANDKGFRIITIERQILTNDEGQPIAKAKWKADTKGVPVVSKDNYIPVKVYETAPLSGAKPEDTLGLRTALTSIIKPEDVALMTAEAQKFAILGADKTYDSPTFKGNGEGIVLKDAYGDKDSKLQGTLRVAVKTGKPSEKDPAKMIYKFKFYDLEDLVNGGLSFPAAKSVMDRAKLSQNNLLIDIKSISAKTSTAKVAEDVVSADKFLYLATEAHIYNAVDFTVLEEQYMLNSRLK